MVLRLQKEGDEVKQQPQKLSAASISQPPHKDIRKKREAQKARRAKNIVRFRAANKGREPFRSETNTRWEERENVWAYISMPRSVDAIRASHVCISKVILESRWALPRVAVASDICLCLFRVSFHSTLWLGADFHVPWSTGVENSAVSIESPPTRRTSKAYEGPTGKLWFYARLRRTPSRAQSDGQPLREQVWKSETGKSAKKSELFSWSL